MDGWIGGWLSEWMNRFILSYWLTTVVKTSMSKIL